jgi:hypothetical protein
VMMLEMEDEAAVFHQGAGNSGARGTAKPGDSG